MPWQDWGSLEGGYTFPDNRVNVIPAEEEDEDSDSTPLTANTLASRVHTIRESYTRLGLNAANMRLYVSRSLYATGLALFNAYGEEYGLREVRQMGAWRRRHWDIAP